MLLAIYLGGLVISFLLVLWDAANFYKKNERHNTDIGVLLACAMLWPIVAIFWAAVGIFYTMSAILNGLIEWLSTKI